MIGSYTNICTPYKDTFFTIVGTIGRDIQEEHPGRTIRLPDIPNRLMMSLQKKENLRERGMPPTIGWLDLRRNL